VAGSLARFPAPTQGTPCHPDEGRQEGNDKAPTAHGQMGLSPANCRKAMTACVQSATMFGAELWWKGNPVTGTQGRAEEIQLLVNQEARATAGCFRTTNLGALSMESGLRAATTQLENRQRRFGLRLLSLPQGDQAREVVGTPAGIGAAAHQRSRIRRTDGEHSPTRGAGNPRRGTTIRGGSEAKTEAERTRPGLTMFTDGSRLGGGATGYAVVWKKGQTWASANVHMGGNQEAYGAECAALAHALELAARRNTTPERITIFSDAQAAIRRMASDEPGPGQQYAIQARKHIAALRRARPGITIEIRWCRPTEVSPATRRPTNGSRVRQGNQAPTDLSHDLSPT